VNNLEYKKKLIEVALPLDAINAESAREKSIRHGHPSTLHLWWSRKPLAAARAVIWASLVDDPSSLPDQFPTEEAQNAERERLFDILSRLVKWENSNNQNVLNEAKAEIMKSTDGNPPALLDPFAGGGAIPLEAQRLGLEAHASDLNPVAVMINKAMIEIPPKFAGLPPVNPESRRQIKTWTGAQGLAEDVRYYGEWMKTKAFERIGHLYPTVNDENGREYTVIVWFWTRTVKCPNPACGCVMPLASSFELSKKRGKEAYIQPIVEGSNIHYEVRYGKDVPPPPKIARGKFKCLLCGGITSGDYVDSEAINGGIGSVPMAIIAKGHNGRKYFSVDNNKMDKTMLAVDNYYLTNNLEYIVPHGKTRGTFASNAQGRYYGFFEFKDYYTNRQLATLTTLSNLVTKAQEMIITDGGSNEYAQAVGVYLSFAIDRVAMSGNCLTRWNSTGEKAQHCFGLQGIPMMWDYAETNIFAEATGSWNSAVFYSCDPLNSLPTNVIGVVRQSDAQTDNGLRKIMVSTDPPYYDNIGYADLSDFFYVWLRHTMKDIYPDIFSTVLVPKAEELVATPYRFNGSKEKANKFFEDGMFQTFKQIYVYAHDDMPVTVYYAYKQSENEGDKTVSTGWETMLYAIIQSGFTITGTWPLRTEMKTRQGAMNANALASSIVLVCRKRPADAPICSRRDFISALRNELKPALQKLQAANIAPVDMAQSAIGPGMGMYSRFSNVLESDGKPMGIRAALQLINQELDRYFTDQDGALDSDSRFCVDLYTQFAFNEIKFGEADVLARAKNTSVEKLAGRGILYAQKGIVRLFTREEIPKKIEKEILWLLTQQLTYALEKDGVVGVAKILADNPAAETAYAKALTYRLYTIAERKGWAQEALAYNSLIIFWQDVQLKASELKKQKQSEKQGELF